jgi:KDO2-lipid IV(A) lauroyltransferase
MPEVARHRFSHRIEYWGLLGVNAVFRTLPHSVALKLGAGIGSAAFNLMKVRRDVVESNAAAALGCPVGGNAVKSLGTGCYENLGMSLAELARLPRLGRMGLERLVSVKGTEHLDRALTNGRGAVLATGHFGNWELMGAAIAQRGYPMNFLVGHQSNKLVDGMLNSMRSSFGIGLVPHGAHVREVLRLLKRNQFVAMLCDHDAGRKGLMINFFGMPASAALGPAIFAARSGAPLMMGFITRDNIGNHHVELTPPICFRSDCDPGEAVADATQQLATIVEDHIRRRPDHWYWVHRRWKTSSARGAEVIRRRPMTPLQTAGPSEPPS